jgi:hypothetical protein
MYLPRIALIIIALWLAGTSTAFAHAGGPYPVLLDEPVGPYLVSALADPDVGTGTFVVAATLPRGEALPADTQVTIMVKPEDGHAAAATYAAARQKTRDGDRFVAHVPFDAQGQWDVRLTLAGETGRGETTFAVTVTPAGTNWATTLLCLLPFVLFGLLWGAKALGRRK